MLSEWFQKCYCIPGQQRRAAEISRELERFLLILERAELPVSLRGGWDMNTAHNSHSKAGISDQR